jgi:hypothetical protein
VSGQTLSSPVLAVSAVSAASMPFTYGTSRLWVRRSADARDAVEGCLIDGLSDV